MSSDYSPQEALEHETRARELLEHGEHELIRLVPLLAAVLAVMAGLSSLYGGRLSERILTLKNEALLHEVSASDLWSEYQAESLKSHLYGISAKTHSGSLGASMQAQAARYKAEQPPLRDQARRHEAARDNDLLEATQAERRKAGIDVAVALFEIAIVLTSIAALTRRPWLLALAAFGGVVAVLFSLRGIFGA